MVSCEGLDWVGLDWFGLDCVCLRLVGAREIIVGLKRARMRDEKTGLARRKHRVNGSEFLTHEVRKRAEFPDL